MLSHRRRRQGYCGLWLYGGCRANDDRCCLLLNLTYISPHHHHSLYTCDSMAERLGRWTSKDKKVVSGQVFTTGTGDCLRTAKPSRSRYVNLRLGIRRGAFTCVECQVIPYGRWRSGEALPLVTIKSYIRPLTFLTVWLHVHAVYIDYEHVFCAVVLIRRNTGWVAFPSVCTTDSNVRQPWQK